MKKEIFKEVKIKFHIIYIEKIIEIENTSLIKNQYQYSNLVYIGSPLTFSQLYYVLNFGSLNIDDEKNMFNAFIF